MRNAELNLLMLEIETRNLPKEGTYRWKKHDQTKTDWRVSLPGSGVTGSSGKRVIGSKRDLTVHHKDHNHDNNPSDGKNWELLCIYCHDNEHSRYLEQEWHNGAASDGEDEPTSTYRPFAGLDALLKNKK